MYSEEFINLSKHRLETALEDLKTAELLLKEQLYKGAANRAYYCVFHCMRAVLALDGIDFKKHTGVITHFRQEYIKTGVFDNELSTIIRDQSLIRNNSDYNDFYVINKDDICEQVKTARVFYEIVLDYLLKTYLKN